MNLRTIPFALALCLSVASHSAHAVTCAAYLTASNPDAAYTDHGDGTVTHIPTGLMWKRCGEGQSWNGSTCTGSASTHYWADALTLARTSSFAGQTDWRLPNLKELRSLVEECRSNPAINDTVFPTTPSSYISSAPSSYFWSGSPVANNSGYAWGVYFALGSAGNYYRSSSYGVRLVRAGQSFGSFDASNGVALSATTLSFAAQNLGTTSAAQTVTLTNNGSTPLNIASIVASGDYAVTHNCGAGIGAGGFCTLNITFTPTATGARTGAVTLTDDSIFSTKTISLSGTGQGAKVSLSATTKTFASQNQGSTSAAQTVTLTNSGVAVLNIASIVASGDFARTTTCGATLAMGANCTLSVTFTPTAAGARSGSVVITSDAASSPDTISLSGTGLAVPVVSLNPASLSFATQTVGTSSAAKTIALTNTGGAALNLISITASGDFAVTSNCGAGLGAGGFCNLSVTFTPTVAGSRTGAITITSNAAGSPHSVSLSNQSKTSQTIGAISFSPATLAVGGTGTVSAIATSGLAVIYTSTTTNICTVSGSTVTAIAAGTCTIAADQAGNTSYGAAAQVIQSLNICGVLPTLSTSSQTANAEGLAGNISVTTTPGCTWTATSNASWITVTSGSSGNGNGSVVYSVVANTGTSSRTGTLTIAGQTFTVTQSGTDAAAAYANQVQAMYIAYFGRPADPGGLANFEAGLLAAGAPTNIQDLLAAYNTSATVKSLIDGFGTSAESNRLYAGDTTAFVTAVYNSVLNRPPLTTGKDFWVLAIDSGRLTKGNAALSIMAGALANTSTQGLIDAALVNNKLLIGSNFTSALATTAQVNAYSGQAAAAAVRAMLATVSEATDSAAFQATITSTVAQLVATAP